MTLSALTSISRGLLPRSRQSWSTGSEIVTFVRNLAASGNFLTDLPVIGKNADVTISKALDFAEALDEVRFQVEKFFDGLPSLTTQQLITFLNDKFQVAGVSYVGALDHFGAAIFSAKSIATTLGGEEYDFKLTIDGVVYHVKGIAGGGARHLTQVLRR